MYWPLPNLKNEFSGQDTCSGPYQIIFIGLHPITGNRLKLYIIFSK